MSARDSLRGAQLFDRLTDAITLKGPELTEAILGGYKDVENRSQRMRRGWVALHTGKSSAEPRMRDAIHHLSPGLPSTHRCPMGAVVGVCFVDRSVRLDTLRAEQGCGDKCRVVPGTLDSKHTASCKLNPHALGPFCSVISAVIRLPVPVLCGGNVGVWKLQPEERQQVIAQLKATSPPSANTSSDTTLACPAVGRCHG